MKYHYEVKNNQVRNLLTNLKKTNKQKTFLHFKDYQQKASDFLDSLYRHNNPVCLWSLFSFSFFFLNFHLEDETSFPIRGVCRPHYSSILLYFFNNAAFASL